MYCSPGDSSMRLPNDPRLGVLASHEWWRCSSSNDARRKKMHALKWVKYQSSDGGSGGGGGGGVDGMKEGRKE